MEEGDTADPVDTEETEDTEVTAVVRGGEGRMVVEQALSTVPVSMNGTAPPRARPPQPCPGCEKPTTWVIRGGACACCYCGAQVPYEPGG